MVARMMGKRMILARMKGGNFDGDKDVTGKDDGKDDSDKVS